MTIYARKVDKNQQEIIDTLRGIGALVLDLHRVGRGVPDLLVGYQGKLVMLEIKTERGKMTPAELEFADLWDEFVYVMRRFLG